MSQSREPSLLVIDPERDDADMLRFALIDGGVDTRRFVWVRTLSEAVDAIGERPPAMVLGRARMPNLTLSALLQELRRTCPGVPVVLYVEDADHEGVLHALRSGAHECLRRSEVPDRLAWALRQAGDRVTWGAEAAAETAQRQEREVLAAIGRLAQGTALEVNNALAVASSTLAAIGSRLVGERTELDESMATADAALDRVRAAMATLVAVGQRAPLRPERIHLGTFLDGVLPMVAREAGPDVNVDHWLLPGLPPVLFDRGALTQVFVHLGSLAAAAMPEGGDLLIRGRLDRGGRFVTLTVTDSGEVPSALHLRQSFQPFSPLHGDSGPGLARVHGLVVQSGGQVTVERGPERGTRITLKLPVGAAPVVAEPVDVQPAEPNGETILVIEDEPALRRLLGRALGRAGYVALTAADTRAAVVLSNSSPRLDLVLSDLVLPHGRVDRVLSELRRAHPGLPLVLMTGQADIPELRGVTVGAPVLRKPFRISALLRVIQVQLAQTREESGDGVNTGSR